MAAPLPPADQARLAQPLGEPLATGVARKARERKTRSVAKRIVWLTEVFQASSAHHTAKAGSSGQCALTARLAALEAQVAVLVQASGQKSDEHTMSGQSGGTLEHSAGLVDKSRPPAGAGGGPTSADVGISGTADMGAEFLNLNTDPVVNTDTVEPTGVKALIAKYEYEVPLGTKAPLGHHTQWAPAEDEQDHAVDNLEDDLTHLAGAPLVHHTQWAPAEVNPDNFAQVFQPIRPIEPTAPAAG